MLKRPSQRDGCRMRHRGDYARTMGFDGNGNVVYSTVDVVRSVQTVAASPTNLAITVK